MAFDPSPYLDALEEELRVIVAAPGAAQAPLYDMLRYHMGWATPEGVPIHGARGKRLRPLLCLLACEAVGGAWRRALPAAAALELTHNFSLIHDDIEDDSPTRHGRPTLWTLWGLAQGINAGDALWTLARLAVYRLSAQGYASETVLAVARRLDETCLALCHGQHLDISFEGRLDVSASAYGQMIAGKTAALLSTATAVGALLGGAAPAVVEAMGRFGHALGLAFQMTDDLLGIWGDPAVTGKSAASDLLARKMTLPVIHALAWEQSRGEDELRRMYADATPGQDTLAAILARLEAAGAHDYVHGQAQAHQTAALAALHGLGLTNAAAQELERLASSIVERER